MKKSIVIWILTLCLALLCACGETAEPAAEAPAPEAQKAAEETLPEEVPAAQPEEAEPEEAETAEASEDVPAQEPVETPAEPTALETALTFVDQDAAALMAVLLRRMGYDAQLVQGTFVRKEGAEPVDHAWVYAVVGGEGVYFDPLYGGSFAEHAEDYCMASAALLRKTHQWDENALQ